MARRLGVFCLEGNWDEDLASRRSLEPMLRLLECHEAIDYVRRDVATSAELDYYLERWGKEKAEFDFGYFAFHGNRGKAIFLDDGKGVSLARLGEKLRKTGAAKGRVIFIASCYGLSVNEQTLQDVHEGTGATAVCGYTEEVDTIEAAAFELLLMNHLQGNWKYVANRLKPFVDRYEALATSLHFVCWPPLE